MSDIQPAHELRDQSAEELRAMLADAQQDLFSLRLQLRTERLRNYAAVTRAKRHLARLKTIIREKEQAAS